MNKFDINGVSRGFPLKLDDIDFMNSATYEAIKGLSSVYGENYIVSGCSFATKGKVTEGYVVLKGELYYVPEHFFSGFTAVEIGKSSSNEIDNNVVEVDPSSKTVLNPIGEPAFDFKTYWEVFQTQPSSGLRSLKYGGSHNAHKIRTARVREGINIPSTGIPIASVPRAEEVFGGIVKTQVQNDITRIQIESGDIINGFQGISNGFYLEKNHTTNMVFARIAFELPQNVSNTSSLVTTIPVGYRPTLQNAVYPRGLRLNIYTGGQVMFAKTQSGAEGEIMISTTWFAA